MADSAETISLDSPIPNPQTEGQDATDGGKSLVGFIQKLLPRRGHTEPSKDEVDNFQIEYNMRHTSRGYCLIFNHLKFSQTCHQYRDGSDVDATKLEATFKQLAFDVRCFRDLKAAQLEKVLNEYRDKVDHTDRDCFAVIILSHGRDGSFFAKDKELQLDWVARQFRPDVCKSLAGKPKLFFIQACRGNFCDPGFEIADGACDSEEETDSGGAFGHRSLRLPLESDFFFFYSTPPGYLSWRNSTKGSWFIQELTEVLATRGTEVEWQHLMLDVQRFVARCYESSEGSDAPGMKQMPVVVSLLRKRIYFRPKN